VQHKQAKQFPKASFATAAELVEDLNHPNGWVRSTAERLLVEGSDKRLVPLLERIAQDSSKSDYSRIQALWSAYLISGQHNASLLASLYTEKRPIVQKAVMQLIRNYPIPAGETAKFSKLTTAMTEQLPDEDPRLRLETLLAISSADDDAPFSGSLWKLYAALDDPWTESALVSIFARDPEQAILAATDLPDVSAAKRTIRELANRVAAKNDGNVAAHLLIALAQKPAKADPAKQIVLEAFVRNLKADANPEWNDQLAAAFRSVLKADESVSTAALPLIARWDKNAQLTPELQPVIKPLLAKLQDAQAADSDRAQIASGLLGIRQMNSDILPAVIAVLEGDNSAILKRRVIEALGSVPDESVGKQLVAVYPKLPFELRDPVFAQITKRNEWSELLLQAIKQKEIELTQLGPALVHRLRTHPDAAIAKEAGEIIDDIRGPELKEKDALIKDFVPAVSQKGNAQKGHEVFTQNCATCHRFKGEGRDLAPDLTGMGAHGPAELLVHILDPNRYVEPNFLTFSIETKDDLSYDGIIARENRNAVTLRNATGDYDIRQDNIKSRRSTGLSLMPNGFEALGQDGLRDLLTFICADEQNKYRIIDLSNAFTADSTRGIYNRLESTNETLQFRRFGLASVQGIPFDIVSPARSANGKNLIVLKGGMNLARTFPQKVEAPAHVKASRLHFLGGVGGWAYPYTRDENLPVAKITVQFADGSNKELILKNGQEIADYNGSADVPGSREAPGLIRNGQVRWFTKDLGRDGEIEKLTFESYNNGVAPTFIAVTAEVGGATSESKPIAKKSSNGGIRTLIVGGGSSHDFEKWFHQADTATLERDGFANVDYTEDLNSIPSRLSETDVLYLCTNNPMDNEQVRKSIFDFVNSGKGLVLVHPGLWYNWKNWSEYNAKLVGGGTHSHDRYQKFEFHVIDKDHPVTQGVAETFALSDELYHFETDPNGTPIQVLAQANLPGSDKSYPNLWITQYPKGRIVCLALGHDAGAHNNPNYQMILRNALKWAAGR
jgi:putative heme-binding domain-containing protein